MLAWELGLAGTVENLPDGTVEVHVQGEEEAVNTFIEAARNPPLGCVKKLEKKKSPVKSEIRYFRIIYGDLVQEFREGFGAIQAVFLESSSRSRNSCG